MKDIQGGDFFLMPFKGTRRELLVKAVQSAGGGNWYVSNEEGLTFRVLLTACKRCPPSTVKRILKVPN